MVLIVRRYTLSDALAVSIFLSVLIRQSQHLGTSFSSRSLAPSSMLNHKDLGRDFLLESRQDCLHRPPHEPG